MKFKKMGGFVRLITFGFASAICLAPFGIYIREKYFYSARIRIHESIHWEQQREMLYLPFYIWYLVEWVIKLFIYGKKSYNNISFEREAKQNENIIYQRERFNWIKYI